jgi:hypothetical protein
MYERMNAKLPAPAAQTSDEAVEDAADEARRQP